MKSDSKTRIRRIMSYFLPNRFTHRTEEEVQRWIIEDTHAETKKEASRDFWNTLDMETDDESYRALQRFKTERNLPQGTTKPRKLFTIRRIAAILIVLVISSAGLYYYNHTRPKPLEYTVARGETQTVTLPDGTQVWINSASTIRYTDAPDASQRTVHLDGEAYFSVQPNPAKPFIVSTANLSVKVLGTRFNIKAYADEPFATAILDKGRIEVNTPGNQSYHLQPQEQLRYNIAADETTISTLTDSDATDWINGTLAFTNATLQEILNTIERKFNVTIDPGNIIHDKQQDITVKFINNDNLDDVMDILTELLGGITYHKQGNTIQLQQP